MRALIAALMLLPMPVLAQTLTDNFGRTITCSGTAPAVTCSSGDGTSIQAATIAQALTTLNGMAPASYAPPVPIITTITRAALLARFTTPEKTAIAAAGTTIDSDAWVILHVHLNLTTLLDLSSPQMQADFATLVTDGLLTQARAAQIMNLGVASP